MSVEVRPPRYFLVVLLCVCACVCVCVCVCSGGCGYSRRAPPLTSCVILGAVTLHTQTLRVYKAFSYVASHLVVITIHQGCPLFPPVPRQGNQAQQRQKNKTSSCENLQ